ncbi:MAG: hypothetical protein PHI85_10765 [Victivallaceae bacterium]|nr:hypothetical protein [Victivallaceae bacterium]
MRISMSVIIAGAALLFCGCRTVEETHYRIEAVDSGDFEAQNALGLALIEAVRAGDFTAAGPLLADGAATEEQFKEFVKRFEQAGAVVKCDFLVALEQPPFVKLIYKIEFMKKAEDPDGNTVDVKNETLFGVLVGNVNGKLVVLMFAPIA